MNAHPLENLKAFFSGLGSTFKGKSSQVLKGRNVKILTEKEIQALTEEHHIDLETFNTAFKAFGENPELAKPLALCISKEITDKKYFSLDSFKREAEDVGKSLGISPHSEEVFIILHDLVDSTGQRRVDLYDKYLDILGRKKETTEYVAKLCGNIPTWCKNDLINCLNNYTTSPEQFLRILEIVSSGKELTRNTTRELFFLTESDLDSVKEQMNSSDDSRTLIYCLALKALNIPFDQLKLLSKEQLEKAVKLIENLPPGFSLQTGYPFLGIAKENLDYPTLLQNATSLPNYLFLVKTSPNANQLTQAHKGVKFPENIWQHYIVRKGDWGKDAYQLDQDKYGTKLHEGVEIGVARSDEWGPERLLLFLASHRKETAEELGQKKTKQSYGLGLLRCGESFVTPCERIYEKLGDDLRKLHEKWIQEKESSYSIEEESSTSITGVIKVKIEDEEIPLSKIKITPESVDVTHTDYAVVPTLLNHVETLYNQALQETDKEKLLYLTGKIFWLLCHSKPWVGGDPSIAEMFIKVIWRHQTGEDLPPWKVGIVPWESVMKEPDIEKFSKNFANLFDFKPKLAVSEE